MLWPTPLFPGKVLLLAEPHSFNASYIRRTLELCGVSLLAPPGDPNVVLDDLTEDDLAVVVGCVAVDLKPETFEALTVEKWAFPFLFVGASSGVGLPGIYPWMPAPFASYQVMDNLLKLMRLGPGSSL